MRLLLTRPQDQCEALKRELIKKGFEVFCLPLIEIHPPRDGGTSLRKALQRLESYHWLIFTSQNALWAVQAFLGEVPKTLKVVAVGPQTAGLAKKIGLHCLVPDNPDGGEGLLKFFKKHGIARQKILYPRSHIAREALVLGLRKMGADVEAVEAYQTKPASVTSEEIQTLLKKGIDAILFFSPSAVKTFFSKIDLKDVLLQKTLFVPVGMTTALALDRQGVPTRLAPPLKQFLTTFPE